MSTGSLDRLEEAEVSPAGEAHDEAVRISIVVPVLNEERSIAPLVHEVRAALADDDIEEPESIGRWELLFVDDGSTDRTWEQISSAASADPRVRGIRLRGNRGKSTALAAGLASSSGSIIATMDGDLQDDPAEIPGMLAQLGPSADLVAGHKAERQDPLSKTLPSRVFNRVTSAVTGLRLHDHNCGLKAGTRAAFESVPLYGEMHRFLAAICHAQGFTVVEQPVNHRPRRHGRSKFGFERYARGALDLLTVVMLTRYARRPAHLFGGLGIVVGFLGGLILTYLAGIWFLTDQPIGDRPLLLLGVLLVILAVQLTSLGVLAELLVSRYAANEDPRRHVAETVTARRG